MGNSLSAMIRDVSGFGLTWLVQSSVLLALGLLAGRLLRRSGPAVQSGAYRTTLAAVLICPFASAALSAAGFDGLSLRLPSPALPRAPELVQPRAANEVDTHAESKVAGLLMGEGERAGGPVPATPADRTEATQSEPLPAAAMAIAPPSLGPGAISAIGLAVWLLGAAFMGLRLCVGQARMRWLRASAVRAEVTAQSLCLDVARQLNVIAPTVWRSPFLFSPCLDGLRRPAILLPDDVGENLRETFIHELAHLARRDGLWNLLRRWTTAGLWLQPLIWLLSRRLEVAAEEVCDDYVVQLGAERTGYAGHLLELAGRALPPLAPASVGMVSLRSMLAQRIVRILDTSRALSTRAGARAIVAMMAVGLAGTVFAGMLGIEGKRAAVASEAMSAAADETIRGQDEAAPEISSRADLPITGRIVDLEGRPVAGVLVKAGRMLTPKSGDLGPWLDGVKKGEPPWVAVRHVDYDSQPAENATHQATTDKDGRFRLEGFGADRVVGLELQGAQIAFTSIEVATRKMAPIPATGFTNTYGPGNQTIYGADFTYTAAPSRPIEGRVKDAKTGQPLALAEIRSYGFAGSNFVGIMTLKTKTDKDGRFRLEGMPKGRGNKVILVPNDEQPYFMQELEIPDPPGAGPVSVELALERGVWIEGTLTEKATGKPVPEAWLHYLPFLANKFAEQYPVFDRNGHTHGVGFQQRYTTKSDGTFKLVGLPGRAIVGAVVNDKKYLQGAGSESIDGMNQHGHFETHRNPVNPGKLWPTVMKEIDPPADAKVVHVDLQVTTGPSVRLTAVDPEGKPIRGLNTRGRSGRSSYDRDSMSNPEAEVTNLMPDEQRIVLLHHEGRKLGKAVTVKKGDDASGPVVVKLAPLAAISGRVVDNDGNPIAGATIRPDVLPSGDFGMQLPQVVSGTDGRFRVPDVPIGCDYAIAVETNTPIMGRRFTFHPRATVKPGETTEVGDIKFGTN